MEQASFLAQIISALAIIASLIFVGAQLQQAARAMRNSSSQAHSEIYAEVISTIIDNGEFASIWRRGLGDPASLDEDEWVRFVACASAQFRAGIALGSLLFIWLAGAVILGLFVLLTRRKKTIQVEE